MGWGEGGAGGGGGERLSLETAEEGMCDVSADTNLPK